ncbi:MAG: sulfatase [Marinilabiliaceae bacterium]
MKTRVLKSAGLASMAMLAACSSGEKKAEKESGKPNILFIMSDDHAYQAISAYDDGLIETPNIDRIADQGVKFTRATVTNSICAPSRATMLTGKHSFVNGKVDNVDPFNWDQNNFAKMLQDAGYQTAFIGKSHLRGAPRGFDHYAVLPGQGNYYNPDFIINGERKEVPGYVTDITTDMSIDWLKDANQNDEPFCLLYHHKAPHRSWFPAERHFREFVDKTFPEPATLFDDYKGRGTAALESEMNVLKDMNWSSDSKLYPEVMEELGIEETLDWGIEAFQNRTGRMNEEQKAAWDEVYGPVNEEFKEQYPEMDERDVMKWRYQRYMQDYLACIAAVDEGVGRVLDYLEENGLADNTIVVYTSDQGFYLGEHGWFDKRFMYKESFRTPLLVKYPKEIDPGTVSDALVQNLDFAPTFLDYAGVDIPDDIQGRSMRKLMSGEDKDWRDAVYYTYYEYPSIHMVKRHHGVATKRYKLMHFYYDVDEWELYDLKQDPHEMTNVYDHPAYKDVREMMHQKLDSIRSHYGDSDANDQQYLESYLEAVGE